LTFGKFIEKINSKGGFRETFGWKRPEGFETDKDYEKLLEACRGIGPDRNRGYQSHLFGQHGGEGSPVFKKYWKGLGHRRIFHASPFNAYSYFQG
jgi:hypothetical protein